MRIVIDARTITDHFPGIGRYTYNLLRTLPEIAPSYRFFAIYNPTAANSRHDLTLLANMPNLELVTSSAPPFSLAEQVQIPALVRQLDADLFHAPYYVRPYLLWPCPSVVTLYDVIPRLFPQEVSPRARILFDALTRLAIRSSQHVLTISTSARNDLVAAYRLNPQHVTVTPLAADNRFRPQPAEVIHEIRERYALPERYILALASNKPHKNLPLLVEAFAHLVGKHTNSVEGVSLVVAGHWDTRYPEAREVAKRFSLGQQVRFLENIADADLPGLYAGAICFAFPSRYEGFGLPPLEAMACGTPVLCGAVSSLPEVIGEAGFLVDVTNAEALSDGLRRLLDSPQLRAELRERGLRQAGTFSWQETARRTLAVYEAHGRHR